MRRRAMLVLQHILTPLSWGPSEDFKCPRCGGKHAKLWTIKRVLADTFGHFPVFRINGEEHLVDGTLPHPVERLPQDAKEVDIEIAAEAWHSTGHYFTLPR